MAFSLLLLSAHAAEETRTAGLLLALKQSGGNLTELESALCEVKGKDTEYLISHASQCDLVNLTAQPIIENVTYARKVHEALPYLARSLTSSGGVSGCCRNGCWMRI